MWLGFATGILRRLTELLADGCLSERHEIREKTQNHEWTRMDTNIEVNHEIHEIHENSEPRMDTNSRSSGFF